MPSISSPCTRICVIDPATGTCEGCARTLDEIGRWGTMSEPERLTIMAGLDERLRALRTERPQPADVA